MSYKDTSSRRDHNVQQATILFMETLHYIDDETSQDAFAIYLVKRVNVTQTGYHTKSILLSFCKSSIMYLPNRLFNLNCNIIIQRNVDNQSHVKCPISDIELYFSIGITDLPT